jgi:glycosyltransferase involved in cell wall biosynthesis
MAKRRILILTNRIPFPLKDGGALAMNAMLEGYVRENWEVYLFSMNTSRHFVNSESLPDIYKQIHFDTFNINTDVKLVPTLKNYFFSRKPNHVDRFYDKDFMKKLDVITSSFDPDIIQLESIYLASYIPAIRQDIDVKIAIRLHNIEHEIWERLATESTSSFKKFYLKDLASRIKRFELNAWNQADILLPITASDAELVRQATRGRKIIVAPFGINASELRKSSGQENWVGFHIGAMDWMPNVEGLRWFLDDIWPALHKAVPAFRFHFAGRNMPGSFEKYESNEITCEGEVASAQEFISDKKILIVPLRSGGGIRIKILEAMAAGKLVVSTSVGMQGIEGVEPGVHFLLADTEADFVDQIKWVMDHKDDAQIISREGSSLVFSKYDQKHIMSRLTKEISAAVSS